MFQVRQCAKMRGDVVKITAGVAVIIAIAIYHHRGNPNRSRAQRSYVIQLLLDSFEIAAVDGLGGAAVVISLSVIIGNIAVEKAVGENLVNILVLPRLLCLHRSDKYETHGKRGPTKIKTKCSHGSVLSAPAAGVFLHSRGSRRGADSRQGAAVGNTKSEGSLAG